jgi:catechol 2,3-dioxygenase-like lactoylglutathione lyase family enzyme
VSPCASLTDRPWPIVAAVPLTTGFNHVAILTSDMNRTVDFYEHAFEATVVAEIPKTEQHPWMKIVEIGGGAALNVFEVAESDIIGERRRQGHRGAVDHFAFAAGSRGALEALKLRLTAAGAQEVGEIQQLGSELSLFFRDADGLELEVCAPID